MTVTALPQHLSALERAQFVRLHRAALKREIRSYKGPDSLEVGRCKLAAVLALPAVDREVFATARLADMMSWVPRFAHGVIVRYLTAVGMSEFVTVEQMTDRQRTTLIDLLEGGLRAVKAAEEDRDIQRWLSGRNAA